MHHFWAGVVKCWGLQLGSGPGSGVQHPPSWHREACGEGGSYERLRPGLQCLESPEPWGGDPPQRGSEDGPIWGQSSVGEQPQLTEDARRDGKGRLPVRCTST